MPLAVDTHLVRVGRIDLLGDQVDIVVLEHGQAPAELAVVPQRSEGVERLVIAIEVETGRRQFGFVPDGGHGKADVRIAGQQRFATAGAAAGQRPGVAAFVLWNASLAQGLLADQCQLLQAFPVGSCQRRTAVQRTFRVPVEVEDVQVFAAELVAHVGQCRFRAKGGGKAVGHVAGNAQGILGGERPWRDAQHIEFHGLGVAVLPGIDAIEVGLQREPGR
ncbi:hypothetical protein D3C76_976300 [compost metagenome]